MGKDRLTKIGDSFRNRPSFMDRVKGLMGSDEEEEKKEQEKKKKEKEKKKEKQKKGPNLDKDKVDAFMKGWNR